MVETHRRISNHRREYFPWKRRFADGSSGEVIRSTEEEKQFQIEMLHNFQKSNEDKSAEALKTLQHAAINQQNLFEVMMDAVKYCSLGQITNALFEVGGKYRRNM